MPTRFKLRSAGGSVCLGVPVKSGITAVADTPFNINASYDILLKGRSRDSGGRMGRVNFC